MGNSRRLVIVIDRCSKCPHCLESGGLMGEASYCGFNKEKNGGKSKFIPPNIGIPSWCELDIVDMDNGEVFSA